MKKNQVNQKKIANAVTNFPNKKNWKNQKNNKWYHKNKQKNNKWYHKNKQKNKKFQRETLFKKFNKYKASLRRRKIFKLTLLERRAYYAFEEFNKRKKIHVFRKPKNNFSVYTPSFLATYFYRSTIEYVGTKTIRRFGFFRWRRYFLRRLIRTRGAYLTHLKIRGSGRWAKKRKYARYNYRNDLKIIKYQLNKWDSIPT